MLTFHRKLISLLGGLIIILDFANAGMVPISSPNPKPGGSRPPLGKPISTSGASQSRPDRPHSSSITTTTAQNPVTFGIMAQKPPSSYSSSQASSGNSQSHLIFTQNAAGTGADPVMIVASTQNAVNETENINNVPLEHMQSIFTSILTSPPEDSILSATQAEPVQNMPSEQTPVQQTVESPAPLSHGAEIADSAIDPVQNTDNVPNLLASQDLSTHVSQEEVPSVLQEPSFSVQQAPSSNENVQSVSLESPPAIVQEPEPIVLQESHPAIVHEPEPNVSQEPIQPATMSEPSSPQIANSSPIANSPSALLQSNIQEDEHHFDIDAYLAQANMVLGGSALYNKPPISHATVQDTFVAGVPEAPVPEITAVFMQEVPIISTEEVPIVPMQEVPLASVPEVPVASVQEVPIISPQEVPMILAQEVPMIHAQVPIIPAQEVPIIPTQEAPMILAQEVPVIPSHEAPMILAQELPVIPSQEVPIIPAQETPIIPIQETPVAPLQEAPIAPLQEVPVAPVHEIPPIPMEEAPTANAPIVLAQEAFTMQIQEVPAQEMIQEAAGNLVNDNNMFTSDSMLAGSQPSPPLTISSEDVLSYENPSLPENLQVPELSIVSPAEIQEHSPSPMPVPEIPPIEMVQNEVSPENVVSDLLSPILEVSASQVVAEAQAEHEVSIAPNIPQLPDVSSEHVLSNEHPVEPIIAPDQTINFANFVEQIPVIQLEEMETSHVAPSSLEVSNDIEHHPSIEANLQSIESLEEHLPSAEAHLETLGPVSTASLITPAEIPSIEGIVPDSVETNSNAAPQNSPAAALEESNDILQTHATQSESSLESSGSGNIVQTVPATVNSPVASEEMHDEEDPPFNVEQYLAQAAFLLGSSRYQPYLQKGYDRHVSANELYYADKHNTRPILEVSSNENSNTDDNAVKGDKYYIDFQESEANKIFATESLIQNEDHLENMLESSRAHQSHPSVIASLIPPTSRESTLSSNHVESYNAPSQETLHTTQSLSRPLSSTHQSDHLDENFLLILPNPSSTLESEGDSLSTVEQDVSMPVTHSEIHGAVPAVELQGSSFSSDEAPPSSNAAMERSRPLRPGISRPSAMGMAPVYTYSGGKLNTPVGEDIKLTHGSLSTTNSKNQNGTFSMLHEHGKPPQHAMVSLLGSSAFNSFFNGSQTDISVPTNTASFIMSQSPTAQEGPARPTVQHAVLNNTNVVGSLNSNSSLNKPTDPSSYHNYYFPQDSVKHASISINNGVVRQIVNSVKNKPQPEQPLISKLDAKKGLEPSATDLLSQDKQKSSVSNGGNQMVKRTASSTSRKGMSRNATVVPELPINPAVTEEVKASTANLTAQPAQQEVQESVMSQEQENEQKNGSFLEHKEISSDGDEKDSATDTEQIVSDSIKEESNNSEHKTDSEIPEEVSSTEQKEEDILEEEEIKSTEQKEDDPIEEEHSDFTEQKESNSIEQSEQKDESVQLESLPLQQAVSSELENETEKQMQAPDEKSVEKEENPSLISAPEKKGTVESKQDGELQEQLVSNETKEDSTAQTSNIKEENQNPTSPQKDSPEPSRPSKQQEKESPPSQASPAKETPPRSPPSPSPKDSPPPAAGPSGPSLPQLPPAPTMIEIPQIPDAMSAPSLGEIAIPEPNINTPNVPQDISGMIGTVSIPPVPTLGDGSKSSNNKGLPASPGKPKPPKKPNGGPGKGNPQQSSVPVAPVPPQQTNEVVEMYTEPEELETYEPETIQEESEMQMEAAEEEDETSPLISDNEATEEGISSKDAPYSTEKALPSKHGRPFPPGYGPGAPSPGFSNSYHGPGIPGNLAPTTGSNAAPEKGCTCQHNNPVDNTGGGKNNNNDSSSGGKHPGNDNNSSGGKHPGNDNNSGGKHPGNDNGGGKNNGNDNSGGKTPTAPSGGGGKNNTPSKNNAAPAPSPAPAPVQSPVIDMESEDDASNVRPPRPSKPKRPVRPNGGGKKPKPKPSGDKNSDKLKDVEVEDDIELFQQSIINNSTMTNPHVGNKLEINTPSVNNASSSSAPVKQTELYSMITVFGWEIPIINWGYFTDIFRGFFVERFRTSSGEFTCDESDNEVTILRSELDVDYLCGDEVDYGRRDIRTLVDSNICNMFCNTNGFTGGMCLPQKSCLCYMSDKKNFAIKLDRLQDYNNSTEKVASEFGEDTCQNCRCLKSCQNRGKYVGYCSKSCHCGVPWYNENPNPEFHSNN